MATKTAGTYRTVWNLLFPSKWVLGMVLILIFGIPRFIIVLQSNVTGQYQWVSIIFVIMWFTPLIFLKKIGRREIGIKVSANPIWIMWGFILGCGMCLLVFIVYRLSFGLDESNVFVYVGRSTATGNDNPLFFLIYLVISMSFSPIGEELFYRGVIHENFKEKFGNTKASLIDSSAFALTHLAHFGIIFRNNAWEFIFLPALIWLVCTFLICIVFNFIKQKSGSILGAIVTHAGFNFSMGFIIFYCL